MITKGSPNSYTHAFGQDYEEVPVTAVIDAMQLLNNSQ